MQKSTRRFLWIGIVIFVLAMAIVFYFQIKNAVTMENVTVDATLAPHDSVDIKLNMLVNNPLFFDFEIKELYYTVSLGEDEIINNATEINKIIDDSTRLTIPVTINYKKVMAKLQELQAQDSTWLDLQLFIRYRLPLLGMQESSLNGSYQIPVPALMELQMEHVQIESFGFKNIDLGIQMKLVNPSDRELTIDNLIFNIKLNESSLVKAMHWDSIAVNPKKNVTFTVPVEVKTGALAKEFFDRITKGDTIGVFLDGSCILKIPNSPIDSLKVFFETEGAMQL